MTVMRDRMTLMAIMMNMQGRHKSIGKMKEIVGGVAGNTLGGHAGGFTAASGAPQRRAGIIIYRRNTDGS
jgi:hypothetical protein